MEGGRDVLPGGRGSSREEDAKSNKVEIRFKG